MARRKQLRGICRDLFDTFTSRNNDLEGYWALGQIMSFLNHAKCPELIINLCDGSVIPPWPDLGGTAMYYRDLLRTMMDASQLPHHWLAAGAVRVTVISPEALACNVEVTSDRGKTYSFGSTERVHPHDPFREGRRGIEGRGPGTRKAYAAQVTAVVNAQTVVAVGPKSANLRHSEWHKGMRPFPRDRGDPRHQRLPIVALLFKVLRRTLLAPSCVWHWLRRDWGSK